jgi:hypothetical protein
LFCLAGFLDRIIAPQKSQRLQKMELDAQVYFQKIADILLCFTKSESPVVKTCLTRRSFLDGLLSISSFPPSFSFPDLHFHRNPQHYYFTFTKRASGFLAIAIL